MARHQHYRQQIQTTEQAMAWLASWTSYAFTRPGTLPAQPWKRASQRELRAVAEALIKVRTAVDTVARAEGTYRP